MARMASGRSMSPRRQARSHGAEQTYEHIAATGLGSRRQDVALLEPPLGGEVEVAPAVGADGAGLLALDVALEPGCVHGLDEEFLGLVEGHEADVPFLRAAGRASGNPAERRRRRVGDYQAGARACIPKRAVDPDSAGLPTRSGAVAGADRPSNRRDRRGGRGRLVAGLDTSRAC